MKSKRKLKRWVRVTLLLLPQIIIIIQLMFIFGILKEISKTNTKPEAEVMVITYG